MKELFHNPNIQNEDNVVVLGDFTAKNDDVTVTNHEFVWDWKPLSNVSDIGYKTVLCFAEYDKREHTLQQLAKFTVWIEPFNNSNNSISPLVDTPTMSHVQLTPVTIPTAFPTPSLTVPRIPESPMSEGSSTAPQDFSVSPRHIDNAFGGELLPESIDKVLQKEKKSIPSVPRPDDDSISQPEDGPLFRATIATLEKKTGNLKLKVKNLLKRSSLVHERQRALVEAYRLFHQALWDISETEVPAFQPIVYNYFGKSGYGQNGIVELIRQSSLEMHQLVIDPLRKLYELEIKSFDMRKREFDDESSQYYSWLSRYLSMKQEAKGKKKLESDFKYVEKRKAFELSRFDYYSYMQDLHGGRKQQDVIYRLALFAESESSRLLSTADRLKKYVKPELDSTISEVKEANKDWNRQRSEREVRRRALERSIISHAEASPVTPHELSIQEVDELKMPNQPVGGGGPPPLRVVTGGIGYSPSRRSGLEPPSASAFSYQDDTTSNEEEDIYDYEQQNNSINLNDSNKSAVSVMSENSDTMNRKEGLLWAMSKPGGINDQLSNLNKAGWHKFWVVLAEGKLCEYTNWKQGLEIHNDPINLKVACVREARNADRRFCFEVVTPNYKRVYQATSDEDMHSWIKSINNGINSSLEGSSGSVKAVTDEEGIKLNKRDHGDGLSDKLNRRISLHRARSIDVGSGENNMQLLNMVQKVDPSNTVCADCGTSNKVEWMSINLLIIICIDCSGVHRSLGSHISKVRSLTLDTVSFTPELVELMHSVNNAKMNKIWEAKLGSRSFKQTPEFNRMSFITEKYVEKKFIKTLERPNAHLRKAVAEQDLIGVVASLVSRANPNSTVAVVSGDTTSAAGSHHPMSLSKKHEEESIFLFALRSAPPGAKTFPVAELLLLNSASLPTAIPTWCSPAVVLYLKRKLPKDTQAPPKIDEVTSGEKKTNVGAKLQKRLSVGFSGSRSAS